ncbi:hypothetical protein NQ318_014366 [Aromia moschata]|uniref:Uncharacterized protein n=1 Tax=Aromia moschata TaxID=1265417 RepID=A0AAV8Z0N9_9CUCU|nr:hypothetical protein NQ318_014366 [Aromia moschata]
MKLPDCHIGFIIIVNIIIDKTHSVTVQVKECGKPIFPTERVICKEPLSETMATSRTMQRGNKTWQSCLHPSAAEIRSTVKHTLSDGRRGQTVTALVDRKRYCSMTSSISRSNTLGFLRRLPKEYEVCKLNNEAGNVATLSSNTAETRVGRAVLLCAITFSTLVEIARASNLTTTTETNEIRIEETRGQSPVRAGRGDGVLLDWWNLKFSYIGSISGGSWVCYMGGHKTLLDLTTIFKFEET